jgi:predicted house-cleaning noncanonical NTP pyrophosphatase (MazG superfamily)
MMVKFLFNKLIRDKLLLVIQNKGVEVEHRVLDSDEYISALKDKLLEEVKELCTAKSKLELKEEIADVLEVIYSLCSGENIDLNEIEEIRLKKLSTNGGFSNKIFIDHVSFIENEERFKNPSKYYRSHPEKYPEVIDQ